MIAAGTGSVEDGSFVMLCRRCDRPVSARQEWVGREVHCPHCRCVIRVPATAPPPGVTVHSEGPDLRTKAEFNFPCARCGCLLEAHTGMCGQAASCPTCAARFVVPFLEIGSRMPERARLLEGEPIDPQPMHAYAASGDQAPQIFRGARDELLIECPRCRQYNPIDENRCLNCATPFTMDAAPTTAKSRRDARATIAVLCGVLGLFAPMTLLPSALALLFGVLATFAPSGYASISRGGVLGIVFGLVGLTGGVLFWYVR